MAVFGTFAKNVISPLIGLFSCGFLHSTNLGQFSFQSILISPSGDLYFLFFQPSEVRPKNRPFLKILPWSPLCYFAKNGRFRYFCEKCYFSSNRSFFMRFFAQHKSRIVQLSIHTNQGIRRLALPIFLAYRSSTKKSAIFENFPLVPPLLFCQNLAVFGTFAKNVISPLIGLFSCGFLHSTNLGQFSFQSILIRPSGDFYFLFFQPSEVRPKNRPFLNISLASPFAILPKMAVFGTFAKNVISPLIGLFSCGFLHSTNLGQFGFQSILIRPPGDLYFLIFQPSEIRPKNRLFLKKFSLGPPFAILPKMAVFGTFGKNVISPLIGLFSCGVLHSTNLGQFSFQSILIRPSGDLHFLFFQPSEVRP